MALLENLNFNSPRIFQLLMKGKSSPVYCFRLYAIENILYSHLLKFGAVCIRRMLLHITIMLLCCTLADLQKQIVAKKRGHLSYIQSMIFKLRENIVLETRFVQISLELRVLFVILEIDWFFLEGKKCIKGHFFP